MANEPVCVRRAATLEEASIIVAWLAEHDIDARIADPGNPGVMAFGVTDPDGIEVYVARSEDSRPGGVAACASTMREAAPKTSMAISPFSATAAAARSIFRRGKRARRRNVRSAVRISTSRNRSGTRPIGVAIGNGSTVRAPPDTNDRLTYLSSGAGVFRLKPQPDADRTRIEDGDCPVP